MIDKIREQVDSKKGKTLSFRFNGARNQVEEFDGQILNTYPGVFLVRVIDENHSVKSFSYSDILTLHLEIKEKE